MMRMHGRTMFLMLAGSIAALSFATFGAAGGNPERVAQAGDHSHHGAHDAAPSGAATSPSSAAFEAANAKMHRDMAIKLSGNADVDFIRGMIPHHQGAVEMARIVLAHGKDPEVRKLANEVIAAQEKEISWMKQWLAKNSK